MVKRKGEKMAEIRLDLTSFQNAIARPGEGLARYLQNEEDGQLRDGLIHRFELTYEISHKMLKRFRVIIRDNYVVLQMPG